MYPKPLKKIIQAPIVKPSPNFNRPIKHPPQFTPWELDTNEYPAASKLQDMFTQNKYSSNPRVSPMYFSDSVLDIPDIEAYTESVTKQGFVESHIPHDEIIEKHEEDAKNVKAVMTQRSTSVTNDNIPPLTENTTNVQTQPSEIGTKVLKHTRSLQNNMEKPHASVKTERKRHMHRYSNDFKAKASLIAMSTTRSHIRNSSLTKEITELKDEIIQERENTPRKSKENGLKLESVVNACQAPEKVIELSSMFGMEVSAVINERKKLIKENVILKAVENMKEKKSKGPRVSQLLPALAVLNNGHSSRRIYQNVEREVKRENELPKSQIPATMKLANPVKDQSSAYFSIERERPPMHSRARSRELKPITLSVENKGVEQRDLPRERTPGHQRQQSLQNQLGQNSERVWLYRINMKSSRLNPIVAKTFDDIAMRTGEARGSPEVGSGYKETSEERLKRREEEYSLENSGSVSPKLGMGKGKSLVSLQIWKKQVENTVKPILFGPNKVPVYMNERKKFLPTEVINGFPTGKKIKNMRGKKELKPTFSAQVL